MKTIAVLTDFSERSAVAVGRAAAIAAATRAEPVLVHAVDDNLPKHVLERRISEAEETLKDEAAGLSPSPRVHVAVGDVYWALHSAATSLHADLIVAGDHRRNPVRDLFSDTTIERLIRVSAVPVLLARTSATLAYRTALVAIESGEGNDLLARLADLGGAGPKRAVLLHAASMSAEGMMYYAGLDADAIDDYRSRVFREARSRLTGLDQPNGITCEIRIEEGLPANAIDETATAEGCDLVVLSSHARRAAVRGLLGSVSSTQIRRGRTDLLIVPRVV